jgi:hypothetical protein
MQHGHHYLGFVLSSPRKECGAECPRSVGSESTEEALLIDQNISSDNEVRRRGREEEKVATTC